MRVNIWGLSRKYPAREHMGSVQKVSSHTLCKRDMYGEDTSYKKHCTQDNDAPVPFKGGTLAPHTVLPEPIPLVKTLHKVLCWNHSQQPCPIFLNLIDGLKSLPFQR